ncbi:hypothetical protein A3K63_05265 [Candidatus Micrarchaeota archaeon RBG_16_49_10]|nr:MAG: hypothetical protein A3K63_05265 [Candidatus Micrarchaeota archaeon RBG_16_49_10]
MAVLVLGIIVLSKSSHWAIDSIVRITRILGVRELIVGFVLISMASTLPEFTVSLSSIMAGNTEISIGNVLGSNVTNIALIIGLMAIVKPLKFNRKTYRELSILLLLTSFIPLFLLNVTFASSTLGYALLLIYGLFILSLVGKKINPRHGIVREEIKEPQKKTFLDHIKNPEFCKSLVFLAIGLVGVIGSSGFVVSSASSIASGMGISATVIGATIVAVGTSLPELSLGLASVRKNHIDLALGEVIGACLINLTLILGTVLAFSPFHVNLRMFTTVLAFTIFTNLVLLFFLDKEEITHEEGFFLFVIYLIFLFVTFGIQMYSGVG